MLCKVERKYLDCVAAMMKDVVDELYQEKIAERIAYQSAEDGYYHLDLNFHWDMLVLAEIKKAADGTPEKTNRGKFMLDDFTVCSNTQYLVAFCLQEGELLPGDKFRDSQRSDGQGLGFRRGKYNKYDLDISVWRQYIQDKYRICPPQLDETFVELIQTLSNICDLRVTGGLIATD